MESGELPVDHAGEEVLGALKETLAVWDEVDEDDNDNKDKAESGVRQRWVNGVDFAMGDDHLPQGQGIVDERERERGEIAVAPAFATTRSLKVVCGRGSSGGS